MHLTIISHHKLYLLASAPLVNHGSGFFFLLFMSVSVCLLFFFSFFLYFIVSKITCHAIILMYIYFYRDLGSQGLKGFISDQIGHLSNLVSL